MIDKHYVMYDDVVRVPLLLRWPGTLPAGRTVDALVTAALDLAVTFCTAANLPVPESFCGQSLAPLAMGTVEAEREAVFASYHGNQFGLYSQRMVRTRRWKYVWNATAEDELYDLAADPAELVNLAGEAVHAGELRGLRAQLVAWMAETKDLLLNQWTKGQLLEGRKIG
jgi:arylsulfatase A-like enzyme